MVNRTSDVATSADTSDHGLLSFGFGLPDLRPPRIEECRRMPPGSRLNLVIPGISEEVSFGGVTTALRFFERLAAEFEFLRIVVTMEAQSRFEPNRWSRWVVDGRGTAPRSIVFTGESATSLTVSAGDFFIATFWTTAVYVRNVIANQAKWFPEARHRFVYLIQDYEPGFYPWSIWHAYARSTYNDHDGTVAVFNSQPLADYFTRTGLYFSEHYVYEPILNSRLQRKRAELGELSKERLILVYGRPSGLRNGFDLISEALRIWASTFPSAGEWSLVSWGEQHADLVLGGSVVLRSMGKTSLEDYACCLSRCWVGISIVFSPHPGYVALEMAEFGAWVITNNWENKNPSELAPNVIAADELTPESVAAKLAWCCTQYQAGRTAAVANLAPVLRSEGDEFPFGTDLVKLWRRADGG